LSGYTDLLTEKENQEANSSGGERFDGCDRSACQRGRGSNFKC
jgi:hypothetical protein